MEAQTPTSDTSEGDLCSFVNTIRVVAAEGKWLTEALAHGALIKPHTVSRRGARWRVRPARI